MADAPDRSLTDEQMRTDYRTERAFLPNIFRELAAVEKQLSEKDVNSDEITLSARSASMLCMGIRSFAKNQTELGGMLGLFGDGFNTGDRGANCDYNPFNRVNFGDL